MLSEYHCELSRIHGVMHATCRKALSGSITPEEFGKKIEQCQQELYEKQCGMER
jgi:hypothetical protein